MRIRPLRAFLQTPPVKESKTQKVQSQNPYKKDNLDTSLKKARRRRYRLRTLPQRTTCEQWKPMQNSSQIIPPAHEPPVAKGKSMSGKKPEIEDVPGKVNLSQNLKRHMRKIGERCSRRTSFTGTMPLSPAWVCPVCILYLLNYPSFRRMGNDTSSFLVN